MPPTLDPRAAPVAADVSRRIDPPDPPGPPLDSADHRLEATVEKATVG